MLKRGVPLLSWKKQLYKEGVGAEILKEEQKRITTKLQAQLNLYIPNRSPFADSAAEVVCETFWQSKLRVSEELAEVAFLLLSLPVSEAAVERTFSFQKFIQRPLRSRLSDAVVQATLFVRFNFVMFGEKKFLPAFFQPTGQADFLA